MLAYTRSSVPIGMAAIAGLLFAAGPAVAQSVQDQKLQVQAVIGDLCTVTAASLDFGSGYDGQNAVNATGSIDISCVTPTTLDVALDGGLAPTAAAVGGRQMTQGASELLYVLYTDQVGGDPWETGEAVTTTIDNGGGSVPVVGSILAQGNGHAPGVHTDEVTITLIF